MLKSKTSKILCIFVTIVYTVCSQERHSTDSLPENSNVSSTIFPITVDTNDVAITSKPEIHSKVISNFSNNNETSSTTIISEVNKPEVFIVSNDLTSNVIEESSTDSSYPIVVTTKTGNISLGSSEKNIIPPNNTLPSGRITSLKQNSIASPIEGYNNTEHNKSIQPYEDTVLTNKPQTCEENLLPEQPTNTGSSILRKCCPVGESIYYGENGKNEYCDVSDKLFNPEIIDATLYRDCITDNERQVDLEIEAGNPCNISLLYSIANGDLLFVLQNGSLLIMDEYGNESYDIKNDYCLDVDYKTGDLFAIVCVAPVVSQLGRSQTILFAIFMIISIPCLILVSFFHFAIRRLRTMHGLCLGFLSSCLAMGFLLHSIAQLSETSKSKVGYAVQYFMLSYFMWLLILCCNVVIIVWYYLPRYIRLSQTARYIHFITYSIFALTIPLSIVLITRSKGIPGMPSYFFQAWSESIQSSQRYFIPPVSTILVFCFILLIVAYFGFRKLDKLVETRSLLRYRSLNRTGKDDTGLPVVDMAMLEETKQDAKAITYLAIIVLTTWIMEVFTFYSPGSDDYLAFMEIINGLQGVIILIFFIGVRHRRHIIVRWWHDRGSLGITEVEMQDLKQSDS